MWPFKKKSNFVESVDAFLSSSGDLLITLNILDQTKVKLTHVIITQKDLDKLNKLLDQKQTATISLKIINKKEIKKE